MCDSIPDSDNEGINEDSCEGSRGVPRGQSVQPMPTFSCLASASKLRLETMCADTKITRRSSLLRPTSVSSASQSVH